MIKFTLLENAIDSIESGIQYLELAIKTNEKKYFKHSLLNLFQGTELILKEILVQKNPILIFDKNSLYKKCENPQKPKIEELYNCKSIDIIEICYEIKKQYGSHFDNLAIKLIENIARDRNKIQHFAIEISSASIQLDLIQLYGKVIKPSFSILNSFSSKDINVLGEKIEELFCLLANADREERVLKISKEDFSRCYCYNCSNYSMFIFFDNQGYPTRFYCTSCPYDNTQINISEFRECPECLTNSLIFDNSLFSGVCLNSKCKNQIDGGMLVSMDICSKCFDYIVEDGKCSCN
jgi:hypothetical protein